MTEEEVESLIPGALVMPDLLEFRDLSRRLLGTPWPETGPWIFLCWTDPEGDHRNSSDDMAEFIAGSNIMRIPRFDLLTRFEFIVLK
tara:strand:- start:26 stop:286 length:261 start_codon:yes stop_codon:yes gene_type:complete